MRFRVFRRTWWKENRTGGWPDNLEPCPGKKRYVRGAVFDTEEEARAFCKSANADADLSAQDRRLDLKYEYERG